MATLKVPSIVPSPQEDAEKLKKAFTGLGTDEGTIVKILAHRNAAQRKLIRDAYADAYGEDLITGLEKEISGDFLHALRLWILDPAERDAKLANDSTKLLTSNNLVLMEIACTRSSSHLFKVRQTYHVMYKKSLEEDVAHHTTGDFRKLLVPLVTAFRYEGDEVNMTLAKTEAKILHDKISEKAYADDEVVRILTTRSKPQINATLNQYNDLFGNLITKELKEDPKNDFFSFLRATIKCLTYPEKYYEKTLRKSIKGLGTDEHALTRVIVTQAETNLQRIKEEYHKRNDVLLEHAITSDTSGDYKKLLLAFVRDEDD